MLDGDFKWEMIMKHFSVNQIDTIVVFHIISVSIVFFLFRIFLRLSLYKTSLEQLKRMVTMNGMNEWMNVSTRGLNRLLLSWVALFSAVIERSNAILSLSIVQRYNGICLNDGQCSHSSSYCIHRKFSSYPIFFIIFFSLVPSNPW